ncbi:hypothetical protein CONCODRAFT_11275 [Conidiobolus coronatus NRRL 28638]|uniref:COX assembly mitochondrial protein n=1 Tax=Conidiobolus coronatus (strain ATCC 28846 / CBS 209.66 / NRRL 28638) TaxID=796925 RepID=A0A137NVV4_CONC2|nr:hypothetical protein CONCODRAFT_11275 [Conidiobolus coronatus NRRL 28638]|eukprot:KXN66808.1 hypothetical protein CONCODRAFT_11275 [Conidiobolus coronatus NRRL 28638]
MNEDNVKLIEQKCAEEIKAMEKCFKNYPKDNLFKCTTEVKATFNCAEKYDSMIKHFTTTCSNLITKCGNCIDTNEKEPQVCMPELKDLLKCYDSVTQSFIS